MASGRAIQGNYVHTHMSGTQGVNATSFSAATNVLVPEHQVWTAPYFRMKGFALQSQLPFGN